MTWEEKIVECLSGFSERDLSNWSGITAFLRLYESTNGSHKDDLIGAIGTIIDMSGDWKIVADLTYIVSTFNNPKLDHHIDQLIASRRFADQPALLEVLERHATVRQRHDR